MLCVQLRICEIVLNPRRGLFLICCRIKLIRSFAAGLTEEQDKRRSVVGKRARQILVYEM